MSRKVTNFDILKELDYLNYWVIHNRCLYELYSNDYKYYKCKFIRWFIKPDLENYKKNYEKYLHRYQVVKDIQSNFHKFITGISMKDFKNTDRLCELLNRLKIIEDVDDMKLNLDDVNTSLSQLTKRIKIMENKK